MTYTVLINYYRFHFKSMSDACTFCTLAKENGEKDVTVEMEFINDEKENNNED